MVGLLNEIRREVARIEWESRRVEEKLVSPLHLCVVEVGIEVGHVILEVLVRVVVDEVDQHRTHGPRQQFLHPLYGHVFELLEFLLGEV